MKHKNSVAKITELELVPRTAALYPGLFTSLPIFLPKRGKSSEDEINVSRFVLDNGDKLEMRGESLDTFDEDTIIGITQLLRKQQLSGSVAAVGEYFGGSAVAVGIDEDESNIVRYFRKLKIGEICQYLGRGSSGSDFKKTRESMVRLSRVALSVHLDSIGKQVECGFFQGLVLDDVERDATIVLDPIMNHFLNEYVTMNIDLRRLLSMTGKAVYRFLMSLENEFTIHLSELAKGIDYKDTLRNFKRSLMGYGGKDPRKGQLEILKEQGMLKEWTIEGNGRSQPFILQGVRGKKYLRNEE